LILFIVGDVLGALCTVVGPSVFSNIRGTVISGMKKNLDAPSHQSSSSSQSPTVSLCL